MRGQQCSKSQLNGGGTGGTTVFYTTMAYGGGEESMCVHVVLALLVFSGSMHPSSPTYRTIDGSEPRARVVRVCLAT